MQTKIVYTLVSDESDTYLEQALLSVYSLRLHNPQAIVELIVDQFTSKTIVDKRSEIRKFITDLITVDVPEDYTKVQKSRYLKTNLRQFVKGDYLFIDCAPPAAASWRPLKTAVSGWRRSAVSRTSPWNWAASITGMYIPFTNIFWNVFPTWPKTT